ncbi:MAG: hypothetical protein LBJ64_04120, partial [Deltaproteobacteria bacterium]|nr:hypothetical protein [Deltaproteobacteria bacterium]
MAGYSDSYDEDDYYLEVDYYYRGDAAYTGIEIAYINNVYYAVSRPVVGAVVYERIQNQAPPPPMRPRRDHPRRPDRPRNVVGNNRGHSPNPGRSLDNRPAPRPNVHQPAPPNHGPSRTQMSRPEPPRPERRPNPPRAEQRPTPPRQEQRPTPPRQEQRQEVQRPAQRPHPPR